MEFTYLEIQRGLTTYLQKVERYKIYRSKISRELRYFYSPGHEYNVVVVSDQLVDVKNDEELNRLVNKMQTSSHHQPKVLILIIQPQPQPDQEIAPGYFQIISDEKNLKAKLAPIFARINHLKIESNEQKSFFKRAAKIGNNEQDPSFEDDDAPVIDLANVQKELKVFTASIRANRLVLTWIMLTLFVLIPLSALIVAYILGLDIYEGTFLGLERLFTGGTNYTLTIAGHQWWRLFSFGFATPASGIIQNLLVIVTGGWGVYTLTKYSETLIGIWRTFGAFLLAYIFTSLFATIMLPDTITGGILPVLAVGVGILISGLGTDLALKSRYVRQRLIFPVLMLIFYPIFNGGLLEYVPLVAGIAFGATVMGFIPHPVKLSRTTLIVYGLILTTLLILTLVFAFLPRYTPAIDHRVVWTLRLYLANGFLPDLDYANNILAKIGWGLRFEELPGWGIGIVG